MPFQGVAFHSIYKNQSNVIMLSAEAPHKRRGSNVSRSSIGSVMAGVFSIGPNVRVFKPSRGNGLLRATEIRSKSSFGREVKPEAPCRKILRHVKITWTDDKNSSQGQIHHCLYSFLLSCYQMTLLVELPQSSGGRTRSFLYPYHSIMVPHAYLSPGG
jgi:hypothetical protein